MQPIVFSEHPGSAERSREARAQAVRQAAEAWDHRQRLISLAQTKGRRRINCVPALGAIFLPWLLFLAVFFSVSLYARYCFPILSLLVPILALLLALQTIRGAYARWKAGGDWFFRGYDGVAFLVAVVLGWLLGDLNFWFHLQPGYDLQHMATYTGVNPSSHTTRAGNMAPTEGKRYQDAGKVYFTGDTYLDGNRSMGFKMGDVYCVAPILSKSCDKNCGQDFWAIGVNCCSEDAADFRCNPNPRARAGLRLTLPHQVPFFRLAVLEAEGAHQMTSIHPLFFYFVEDPNEEVRKMMHRGYANVVIAMCAFFACNMAAVCFTLKGLFSTPTG